MNPGAAALEAARWRGAISTTVAEHDERLDEHDDRIAALERDAWRLSGKLALGSILGSITGGVAVGLILFAIERATT